MVGFIVKNSSDKQTQGFRAYQPKVSNPKTILQANQRLALKPLNSVARALGPVIERGFEGVKYGAQSRQKFLSVNLANFNGPYVVKGEERVIPGPMQISSGSIVPVSVTGFEGVAGDPTPFVNTDIFVGGLARPANLGVVAAALIANNTDIKQGDQLTFVSVYSVGDSFVYRWFSMPVDIADVTEVTYAGGINRIAGSDFYFATRSAGSSVRFDFGMQKDTDESIVAAAVIVSREGETRPMRSPASLVVNPQSNVNWFFTMGALEQALNSYGNTSSLDWPVEIPDADSPILQKTVAVTVPVSDLDAATATQFPAGLDALGYTLANSTSGVWVSSSGLLFGMNGNPISWTPEGGQLTQAKLKDGATIATKPYTER